MADWAVVGDARFSRSRTLGTFEIGVIFVAVAVKRLAGVRNDDNRQKEEIKSGVVFRRRLHIRVQIYDIFAGGAILRSNIAAFWDGGKTIRTAKFSAVRMVIYGNYIIQSYTESRYYMYSDD